MLSRAGADRVQTGMRNSFGKPEGLCARVGKSKTILSIRCKRKDTLKIMEITKECIYKIPGKQRVLLSKNWGLTKVKILEFVNKSKRK